MQKQSEVVRDPLWVLDIERLKLLSEAMQADRDIAYIVVRDDTGEELYSHGTTLAEEDSLQQTIEIRNSHDSDNTLIGSLTIIMSKQSLQQRFAYRLYFELLLFACLLLISIFSALYSFRKTIYHPLHNLLCAIDHYDSTGNVTEIHIDVDEGMKQVIDAFNQMQNNQFRQKMALQNIHEQLEEKVRERTKELNLALESAQAASKAKSQFLTTISHEIRTPMNGILGTAQLLQDEELTDEQQKLVHTIIESGDALLLIINEILDFSKMEAGKMELDIQPFSMHQLLTQACSLFNAQAAIKQLQLNLHCELSLAPAYLGDAGRIRQIVVNITGNALKFTNRGFITINATETDDHQVRITITDSGIGMSEDVCATIFEPFTQADSSTTRKYGGTGLGLTIVNKLVQLMNGRISVESVPEHGTTFIITLPLQRSTDIIETPPQTTLAQQLHEDVVLQGRVLLVEDDKINQMIAIGMLQKFGLEVDLANNGAEAVAKWQQQSYHVILMDCNMPVMDGYEAAAAIRAEETTESRIPIIALTANIAADDRVRTVTAGMDDFLGKPIRKEELFAMLQQWLPTELN